MGHSYQAVGWNRQKRVYDTTLLSVVALYLLSFVGIGLAVRPEITAETLIIRACGTAAFLLLHVILSIGPLCRLDRRFLPLLYNRRIGKVWKILFVVRRYRYRQRWQKY